MQKYMQLSIGQIARLTELGIDLFAQLRTPPNAEMDPEVTALHWHIQPVSALQNLIVIALAFLACALEACFLRMLLKERPHVQFDSGR